MLTEPEDDIVFLEDGGDEGTTNQNDGFDNAPVFPHTNNPIMTAASSNVLSTPAVAVASTAIVAPTPASALTSDDASSGIVRINCGGGAFIDLLGNRWEADSYYTGGSPYYSKSVSVQRTYRDTLYMSERTGPEIVFYLFPYLPIGPVTVKLHYAEIYWTVPNARLFDVIIQGLKVAKNYDVWTKAGGTGIPIVETYHSEVTNGTLTMLFVTVKEQLKISGIEIIPGVHTSEQPDYLPTLMEAQPHNIPHSLPQQPTFAGIRINCGGNTYIDKLGQVWEYDNLNSYFTGGSTYSNHELVIQGTLDDMMYQTTRTGPGIISYVFPNIPRNHVTIKLYFAEIYWEKANARIFDVYIEGVKVATRYDIWSNAGGKGKVVIETYDSFVMDGKLTIKFATIKDQMNISAIEVLPASF